MQLLRSHRFNRSAGEIGSCLVFSDALDLQAQAHSLDREDFPGHGSSEGLAQLNPITLQEFLLKAAQADCAGNTLQVNSILNFVLEGLVEYPC